MGKNFILLIRQLVLQSVFIVFLFSIDINAQIIENFEGTSSISMNVFTSGLSNDTSNITSSVLNPTKTTTNNSNKVGKLVRDMDGVVWAGLWSQTPIDVTYNKFIHVKVYKTRISTIKFKLEGGPNNSILEISSKYPQTLVNQWEDIVFDFSNLTGKYNTFSLLLDYANPVGLSSDINIYFDDIVLNNSSLPFSGTYYSISGSTGIAGTTLNYVDSIDGLPKSVVSNSTGSYAVNVAPGWNGAIIPTKAGYTFSANKKSYSNVISNYANQNFTPTATGENLTITTLFQNSYKLYKDIRKSNGIYLDALSLNNSAEKPASIVANGVGLISLCIGDAMYKKTGDPIWETNAENLVNQTLQTFIGFKNAGKVNSEGMFKRYFAYATGDADGSWSTEYSTVDNAIFALGVIFCKNYFSSNASIVANANTLLNSMDYTKAIGTSQIYMILDQNGVGSAPTVPYNEYMLVSWLAKNAPVSNPRYANAQSFWNTYFSNPSTSVLPKKNYWGSETLSDSSQHWLSSFIPQFCYYLCNYYKNNSTYMTYFLNAKNSDALYFSKLGAPSSFVWGVGAGEIPGGGYSADAIENNPNKIVSPHIIAGYIPVNVQSKTDLLSLYNNGTGAAVYGLPSDTSKKVLWRYLYDNTNLRTPYIQAVDFSTMLYGLSSLSEYLGSNWFNTYNTVSTFGSTGSLSARSSNVLSDNKNVSVNEKIYFNSNTREISLENLENGQKKIELYSLDGVLINSVMTMKDNLSISTKNMKNSYAIVLIQTQSRVIKKKILVN